MELEGSSKINYPDETIQTDLGREVVLLTYLQKYLNSLDEEITRLTLNKGKGIELLYSLKQIKRLLSMASFCAKHLSEDDQLNLNEYLEGIKAPLKTFLLTISEDDPQNIKDVVESLRVMSLFVN